MTEQEGDEVLLVGNDMWERIQSPIQARLREGRERIQLLRNAIARDAKVRRMPPVWIDPTIWMEGEDICIHAASGAWPRAQGGSTLGVVVAAGPAICRDDAVVRAILVRVRALLHDRDKDNRAS